MSEKLSRESFPKRFAAAAGYLVDPESYSLVKNEFLDEPGLRPCAYLVPSAEASDFFVKAEAAREEKNYAKAKAFYDLGFAANENYVWPEEHLYIYMGYVRVCEELGRWDKTEYPLSVCNKYEFYKSEAAKIIERRKAILETSKLKTVCANDRVAKIMQSVREAFPEVTVPIYVETYANPMDRLYIYDRYQPGVKRTDMPMDSVCHAELFPAMKDKVVIMIPDECCTSETEDIVVSGFLAQELAKWVLYFYPDVTRLAYELPSWSRNNLINSVTKRLKKADCRFESSFANSEILVGYLAITRGFEEDFIAADTFSGTMKDPKDRFGHVGSIYDDKNTCSCNLCRVME